MYLLFRVCMDCENEKHNYVTGMQTNPAGVWEEQTEKKAKSVHSYDSLQYHLSLDNLGRSVRHPDILGLLEPLFEGLGIHTSFINRKTQRG